MSQFLTNKYLRYRGLELVGQTERMIDTDRPCAKCDYNLRGLSNRGTCPECGTPIPVISPARSSLLSDAPLSEIRALALGIWLAVLSVIAAPVVLALTSGVSIWTGAWSLATFAVAMLVVSAMWFVAVWCMTPVLTGEGGTRYGFAAGSRLRMVARWSQLGWPGAVLLIVWQPVGGMALGMATVGLILLGLGGLVALSLVLSRLADWACDETAAALLNLTIWMLPLATGLLLLIPVFSIAGLFGCVGILMWWGSLIAFGLALLSLASSASWSWRHALERMRRDEQQRSRMVKRPPMAPLPDEPIALSDGTEPLPVLGLAGEIDLPKLDVVDRDVHCIHCQYNLRGLKVHGRCPECGERISM